MFVFDFFSENSCLSTKEAFCSAVFTAVSVPATGSDVQGQQDRLLGFLLQQTHAGFAAVQLLSSTPGQQHCHFPDGERFGTTTPFNVTRSCVERHGSDYTCISFMFPGLAQYEQTLTRNLLHCIENLSSMQLHCQLSTTDLIQELLTSESYEVRWETLEHLLKFGKYRDLACDEDAEEELPHRYVTLLFVNFDLAKIKKMFAPAATHKGTFFFTEFLTSSAWIHPGKCGLRHLLCFQSRP